MFVRVDDGKLPQPKSPVRDVRIACILDEFSMAGFGPEADFMQLTPANWERELHDFQPQVLLVESAWRGHNNLWTNTVARCGPEIMGILKWCKERGIPTVFWNKEDPVHFATFLNLASYFDVVLTSDMDSVPRYKQLLQNHNVHFFPFAAQTRVHNPIAEFKRLDAFSLAGSYYHRYPERTRALESFITELSPIRPFIIFDRNFRDSGTQHEDYLFPESYEKFIVGRLNPSEIEYAYKGFTTSINLNSVVTSQTMLARRVYELIASNTLVISNYSRALEILFGDLVIKSDRGKMISQQLSRLTTDSLGESRLRAQALRKVLREHTYRHRLEKILDVVGMTSKSPEMHLGVLSWASNQIELDLILATIRRQKKQPDKVVIVTEEAGIWKTTGPIELYSRAETAHLPVSQLFPKGTLLAVLHPQDFYGPNYLEDLVLAREYVNSPIISKGSALSRSLDSAGSRGTPNIENLHDETPEAYTLINEVELRRSIVDTSILEKTDIGSFQEFIESSDYEAFAIDSFEYLRGGIYASDTSQKRVMSSTFGEGFSLSSLEDLAASVEACSVTRQTNFIELFEDFATRGENYALIRSNGVVRIESTLEQDQHTYIYAKSKTNIKDLPWTRDGTLFMETTPGISTMFVMLFFDKAGQRLGHTMVRANTNHAFQIPEGTVQCQFALRIMGTGHIDILNLYPEHYTAASVGPRTQAKHVVLTNIYPSYDDIYRNGFVHSRVLAYREAGIDVEVVRLTSTSVPIFREYEGVSVLELNRRDLELFLANNPIESVLVHFLKPDMYHVLANPQLNITVQIWIHGSDIQPWWRRKFNATTPKEITKAQLQSEKRMALWSEIFEDIPAHFSFVFVSQFFAEQVMKDYEVSLPQSKYQVIHNPIDTDTFSYIPKDRAQRKKILSIRPYSSRTYANDLSVEAVRLLSHESFFQELEFRFIGDGPLFEEALAPLRGFDNVIIEQGFLNHSEIADLHKEYGVLLIPSRMDSHGVSRDEGMSSGLVPVTTEVAAIPEFVDDTCGILAPPEDAQAIADGIKKLYAHPHLFERMSKAAAKRVRSQASKDIVIRKELDLLEKADAGASEISAGSTERFRMGRKGR